MIKEHDFNDKQRELYDLMSSISEDHYCAGWIMGLEHSIWGALQGKYRHPDMDTEKLNRCGTLAKDLDGWIIWFDEYYDKSAPSDEHGPRFVTMEYWLHHLEHRHRWNW